MAAKSGSQPYVPERGDLVWLTFDSQAGRPGRRPAVVLSPSSYNKKSGLAVFVPVRSQRKHYPFEVELPPGLQIAGVVLTDQIKSLDWMVRQAKLIARLPEEVSRAILHRAALLLKAG